MRLVLNRWLRTTYAPFILTSLGRALVLSALVGSLVAGIYGTTKVPMVLLPFSISFFSRRTPMIYWYRAMYDRQRGVPMGQFSRHFYPKIIVESSKVYANVLVTKKEHSFTPK